MQREALDRLLRPVYERLRKMPPGQASDDLAALAASLELAMQEQDAQVGYVQDLEAWHEHTQTAIDDLNRRLGHDSDQGDVEKLSRAVERLLERAQVQEAAIRTALAKPKSDEAIQALSRALHGTR